MNNHDRPVIKPKIIESDESYMSTEEYSSNSPIVHKSCQLHTSTEFPKHLNWILSSVSKLVYLLCNICVVFKCHKTAVSKNSLYFTIHDRLYLYCIYTFMSDSHNILILFICILLYINIYSIKTGDYLIIIIF